MDGGKVERLEAKTSESLFSKPANDTPIESTVESRYGNDASDKDEEREEREGKEEKYEAVEEEREEEEGKWEKIAETESLILSTSTSFKEEFKEDTYASTSESRADILDERWEVGRDGLFDRRSDISPFDFSTMEALISCSEGGIETEGRERG